MKSKGLNSRASAARVCWQIIDKGQSLDAALGKELSALGSDAADRGFIQELVYGICRWYGDLDYVSQQLLAKPIRNKDRILHFILLVGLYQLRHLNTADHAAIAETVSACKQLNKQWASKLINGCLRSYQRMTDASQPAPAWAAIQHSKTHPAWLQQSIEQAWPQQAEAILAANDLRPPMCIRVNSMRIDRDAYLQMLVAREIDARNDPFSNDGIILSSPVGVDQLPQFAEGYASVQDTAAQLACYIASPVAGEKVLDACAAPGGKAAHLLEYSNNQVTLDALDISATRSEKIDDTLTRLGLIANVQSADASDLTSWTQPTGGYDLILIDAPCSGTGVIRRHPDIKHHRTKDDIKQLAKIQQQLLNALWQCLKPGGRLLYMTCSILPDENMNQIKAFIGKRSDASLGDFFHPNAINLEHGKQALQGVHDMDGFYYCLLLKNSHL